MRRALQIAMAILSIAPLGFGLGNMFAGAGGLMPNWPITPDLDSQFRYQSGVYICITALLWWMIPRIEQVGWPFRAMALGLFVGGIGRLINIQEFGVPSAPMYYGMMLELSMPIFVAWQYWVEKAAKTGE